LQRTVNPSPKGIVGSSPTETAIFCRYSIAANVQDCQSCDEGSIPSTCSIFVPID